MTNKKRRCLNCKEYFYIDTGMILPVGFLHNTDCAASYSIKASHKLREKKIRVRHADDKRRFKDSNLPYQHKLTQKVFNRLRVLQELKWFFDRGLEPECISCGKQNMDWACGHFKPRGVQGNLRYDEMNTFLQCNRYCNMALSGNINGNKTSRGYIQGLLERFGKEKGQEILDYCESHTEVKRWTGNELKEMRAGFSAKIKAVKT